MAANRLVLDRFRTGAFTSMIAFEVSWLFVLWVLWIASAGLASDSIAKEFPDGCHSYWSMFSITSFNASHSRPCS